MSYTIGKIAELTNLPISTIRYYDTEGLLPCVERTISGQRRFHDCDVSWLSIIDCLKKTGMSIKEIKEYVHLYKNGDETLQKRLELMKEHRLNVEKQIDMLKEQLYKIDCKIWYYETAIEAGSESIHEGYCVDLYEKWIAQDKEKQSKHNYTEEV